MQPKLSKKAFLIGQSLIESNWGRELPDEVSRFWYEALLVYTDEEFMNAIALFLKEEKGDFMPPFARLIDRCNAERRKRPPLAQLESSEAKCDAEFDRMTPVERDRVIRENRARMSEIVQKLAQKNGSAN